MTRICKSIWIACAVAILLAACAGDDRHGDDGGQGPGSGESEFIGGQECPAARAPSLPEGSGCVSVVVEGDHTLWVFALLDDADHPETWHARVSGPDEQVERDLGELSDYPRAVAASDVDLDGRSDWWIQMGDYASHGTKWAYLNLFFVEGGTLEPLRLDGEPFAINYGGISRMGEGAECRDGTLVLVRAEAQDPRNTRWVTSERILELDGSEATLARREEGVVVVDDYVDPRIRRYFRVECGDHSLVPV